MTEPSFYRRHGNFVSLEQLHTMGNDMSSLKDEVKAIVEIVAEVPEPLRAMCFEMLLKEALTSHRAPPPPMQPAPPSNAAKTAPPTPATPVPSEDAADGNTINKVLVPGVQPKVSDGADIALSDLHMKTRKFMESNGIPIEQLNNLVYKNDSTFEWLISDLGVTGMAEGQLRISLLQCLHGALTTGDFETSVEAVREECKMRKCYDPANFNAIIKRNADTYDFGTWSKDVVTLRLSSSGRKALAEAVKGYK